jgi:hypothetical protein
MSIKRLMEGRKERAYPRWLKLLMLAAIVLFILLTKHVQVR